MTEEIAKFYDALSDLVKSFEQKNVTLKMTQDLDSGMVKIYGERSSALTRAKAGLDEVAELAYDTAEHHPYWNLLYDGSQILKIVLEKWNEDLTEDELKEIKWYAEKIKDATANVSGNHHH
ncbi:MAG TPA: hypothetical protein VJR22_06990 [Candidatus Nitrosotalea sp.]|nr:hypothetical protein [Nitrososphaerota archaeon]HKU33574.1 hypothetical protein [Candidatus Nitrosotalea sp.]